MLRSPFPCLDLSCTLWKGVSSFLILLINKKDLLCFSLKKKKKASESILMCSSLLQWLIKIFGLFCRPNGVPLQAVIMQLILLLVVEAMTFPAAAHIAFAGM